MRVSAVLMIGLLAAACGRAAAPEPPNANAPGTSFAAAPVAAHPQVGAVFLGGGSLHTCTAAVLDSAAGDLILTAAHCVAEGIDTTFVAGFDGTAGDADPANVWKVDAIYLDARWVTDHDPLADFAIIRVGRDGGGTVEEEAGGGLVLGSAPKPGTVVTVTGYELGVGGGPIGCTAPTGSGPSGFPSLPCTGLVDGTSGAPWMTGSTVTGLVGGLDGGGCDENVSYSPPFDDRIGQLLARAEAGGPADKAPEVFDSGC
jgi:Trypsin